jgi:hypothetical protein
MSRFSPGGLHGHHPGLAPAGSGHQGGLPHTLPHTKAENFDAVSNVYHQLNHHGSIHSGEKEAEKECLVKKEDVNRIPKHAGSPYSLPGYMSRFPPGGLQGHHPGLSPGAGLDPHRGHPHTLPHIKPGNVDAVSNVNHQLNHHGSIHRGEKEKEAEKECLVKKKDLNRIPKPLNAFMLYMQEMRPVVKAECTLKESAAINKILGKEILESFLFNFCMYLGPFILPL